MANNNGTPSDAEEVMHQTYSCTHPGCDKTFKLKHKLTRRLLIHKSPTFQCDKRPVKMRRLDNFKKHMEMHEQNKSIGEAFL